MGNKMHAWGSRSGDGLVDWSISRERREGEDEWETLCDGSWIYSRVTMWEKT